MRHLQRIVDHDLPEAGFAVRRPAAVLAWRKAYAAATSASASWETIRKAATSGVDNKPARDTTIAYTELLKGLRILDPIDAWTTSRNSFRRLSIAPKHHLSDPAATFLLAITGPYPCRSTARFSATSSSPW